MQELRNLRSEFVRALSARYDESEAAAMFRHLQADLSEAAHLQNLRDRISQVLPGLLAGRPFQYVTGTAWFYGMQLQVNESVLIPRPETEELVKKIVDDVQLSGQSRGLKNTSGILSSGRPRFIDIGTGSGCIALALKKSMPDATVYALDLSGEALAIARKNAADHQLKVEFIEADILDWELIVDQELYFDAVVSNPPYITPGERAQMEPHVLDFEPELALFVPEEAPLLFYQHIADFAQAHLYPGGRLYFEINQVYGADVAHLLERKGYEAVELLKDMQGADRMVTATKVRITPDFQE